MGVDGRIRLIVNADDFGTSHGANRAIVRAHREGIVTSASLMVNGDAAGHAVRMARENPDLGVGLHLVLAGGKSTLKPSEILGVVNHRFEFERSPVRAGLRYQFNRRLQPFVRQEIDAQFREFRTAGLQLDHVNGHLHFHLHPFVLRTLKRHASDWNVRALRLPRDPLLLNLRIAFGRYLYRFSHALVFSLLTRGEAASLARRRIVHVDHVFGLLQSGRITEKYLLRLIDNLYPGTFELYAHPDEGANAHETEALCSPAVRRRIEERGIELIRYGDLSRP